MEDNKNFFLKVLSNISSLIIKKDEERKELEEKKKKAEEEKLRDHYEEVVGYRYPTQWMKDHEQDYINGKYKGYKYDDSPYYNNYGNWDGGPATIYFYEWSDINGNQKKFFSILEFSRFCDQCGITLTDANKREIRLNNISYITCAPGRKDKLLIAMSYSSLEVALSLNN